MIRQSTTQAASRSKTRETRKTGNGRTVRGASPQVPITELKARLREIGDLNYAAAILDWDQATYMPQAGADARSRQAALLRRLAHERATAAELGRVIDGLAAHGESLSPESDEASLIRVARRDFDRAIRVPAEFVERAAAHNGASFDAWTRARPASDFAAMRPFLEKTIELSREYAGFFSPWKNVADPLIDTFDPGMTTDKVRELFAALRAELVPIVHAIAGQSEVDASALRGIFPEAAQLAFNAAVARRLGYDFDRGRIDKTHHPFCTKFSASDVRITTRIDPHDICEALFSTVHEAGHAMYEQGVGAALAETPLGSGVSAGVHESQSRLWENAIGRSREFWEHFFPLLQETFAEPFGAMPLGTFYRLINKVARSLIRTDADEVTYNLHIMMRFDLEQDMLEGRLAVRDLPEAWRVRMAADLGVAPNDDRDGCLQDVHWYCGLIGGAFQGYTIGNVLAAQFHAAARRAHPDIAREIARGEFGTLRGWLVQEVHRHGRKFEPHDLVRRATGAPIDIAPYLAYLRSKYGELYRLPPAMPAAMR